MKRGTELKLKFRELKQALGLPIWQVKGILQALWDFVGENAIHGDVGRFSDEQIAVGIEYAGDAQNLMRILRETRWLDAHPTHRLVVHDWHEHCEDRVKKWVEREARDKGGPGFASAKNVSKHHDGGGQQRTTADDVRQCPTTADNGSLPEPEPEPIPEPKKEAASGDAIGSRKKKTKPEPVIPERLAADPEFLAAWESWQADRRERGKTLTSRAIARQLKFLETLGPAGAVISIDQAIEHGWQGLFPPNGGARIIQATSAPKPVDETTTELRQAPGTPPDEWTRFREQLRGQVDDEAYNTWLAPLMFGSLHDGRLTLLAPTSFLRNWVVNTYLDHIETAWAFASLKTPDEIQIGLYCEAELEPLKGLVL